MIILYIYNVHNYTYIIYYTYATLYFIVIHYRSLSYFTVLYFAILYFTIFYCTLLIFIMRYYIVIYCSIHYSHSSQACAGSLQTPQRKILQSGIHIFKFGRKRFKFMERVGSTFEIQGCLRIFRVPNIAYTGPTFCFEIGRWCDHVLPMTSPATQTRHHSRKFTSRFQGVGHPSGCEGPLSGPFCRNYHWG